MRCRKNSMVSHNKVKKKPRVKPLKSFVKGEKASVSVLLIIMFPVIMTVMVFFENIMEVKYVVSETQSILDLSTRGAAMTGDGVKSGSNIICTIPYDETDEENSGYHVARKLLRSNLAERTLPQSAVDAIWKKVLDNSIEGFNTRDTDEWASGKAKIDLTFSYKPTATLLGRKYRVHVVSISKCTASLPDDDSGNHLTQEGGIFQGPSGKETYYNMNMAKILYNIQHGEGGFEHCEEMRDMKYSVRDDGVKMIGPYIMVAANLQTHPKGSIVETSLGTAIVVDQCEAAASDRTLLDVATAWNPYKENGCTCTIDKEGIAHC